MTVLQLGVQAARKPVDHRAAKACRHALRQC